VWPADGGVPVSAHSIDRPDDPPVPLAPVAFVVTADPTATASDPAAAVVPATIVDIPLTAGGTFPSTGKRIDQAAATGSVRWRNCDPTRSYTIPGHARPHAG